MGFRLLPKFITHDDEMYYHLSNNINHNYYYLRVKNEKYLKYLSNNNSKYNNEYFDNLKFAYEISNTNSDILLDTQKLNECKNNDFFKSNISKANSHLTSTQNSQLDV